MATIRPLALLVFVLLAAPLARAEEPPSAQATYEARAATLPAPSEKHAFAVDCDLVAGGQVLGRATFSAAPMDAEGAALWEIRETMVFGGGAIRRKLVTYLNGRLEPLRGSVEGVKPEEGAFHVAWYRSGDRFLLEHTTGEGEARSVREETLTHEAPYLSTITALWLFCRMNLDRPGSFEVTLFDADPAKGETNFERGTWTIPTVGTWNEVEAYVVKGAKGTSVTMETGFHAATGALLGVRFRVRDQPEIEFRVRGDEEPAKTPGLPYTPATTAKDAALQGALALAVGDVELLDKTLHWPTFHAYAKARHDAAQEGKEAPEPFDTEEAFRAKVLADLRKSLGQRPVAMIKMALKMAEGGLEETPLEGFTRVKFPDVFRGMEVDVAEVDDVFYLVRLPGKPD